MKIKNTVNTTCNFFKKDCRELYQKKLIIRWEGKLGKVLKLLIAFPTSSVIDGDVTKGTRHKKRNSSLVLDSKASRRKLFWWSRFLTPFRKSKKVKKSKKKKNEAKTKKASTKVKKETKKNKKGKNKKSMGSKLINVCLRIHSNNV
jgi:hypothetical protein